MATDLSFLEPAFKNMAATAGIIQNIQQAAAQQDELAERKRAAMANEAVAGRHADIAQQAQQDKEAQDDFANRLTLNAQGAQPLASDGRYSMPTQAAPMTTGAQGQSFTGPPTQDQSLAAVPLQSQPAASLPAQVESEPSDMQVHFGGKLYRIPPMDEQTMAEAGRQSVIGSAADDVKLKKYGVELPDEIAKEFKMEPGQKILPDHLNALTQIHALMNPAPAESKPKNLVGVHRIDDQGNATDQFYDPASGDLVKTTKTPGIGPTAEAKHPGASEKVATPGQYSAVDKDKAAALKGSADELKKELDAAQAAYTKDDTFDRTGAIRQAYANHYARMQQAQLTYEARRSELSGQDVGHNSWADDAAAAANAQPGGTAPAVTAPAAGPGRGAPAAPAPAAPAKPAAVPTAKPAAPAAKAGPKIATMGDVNAAVKASGLTKAQVLRSFQSKGWNIGQVQ